MAKLYFRYGAMDSSKSANLLMVAYNYKKQGKNAILMKPSTDTRSHQGYIESRIGLGAECIDIGLEDNILDIMREQADEKEVDCLLVDECQFMTEKQVLQIVDVVDVLNIPTICYGLKNSYIPGELFEGSRALLYYAESIEEIKTVCAYCNKKATMNLRFSGGKPVYQGSQVVMGGTSAGEDRYLPVCRRHYLHPPVNA
ncbi:MAG: thymidine kinase [Eubacteriales bacterium]|nr:thymidine kinase [Eubacteriales bacterium]